MFQAIDDPKRPLGVPIAEAAAPVLNFAPLENASIALNRSAAEYRKAYEKVNLNGGSALASASLT